MSTYTRSGINSSWQSANRRQSYGVATSRGRAGKRKLPFAGTLPFSIAPGKLILWSLVAGVCGFAYITHVFTTQQLLQEVNEVRLEHDKVKNVHEDQLLTYEQLTGPAAVFTRARTLGYEQSGPADYVIIRGER